MRCFSIPRIPITRANLRRIVPDLDKCNGDDCFSVDYFFPVCPYLEAIDIQGVDRGPLFVEFLSLCDKWLKDIKVSGAGFDQLNAISQFCNNLTSLDLGRVESVDEPALMDIISNCLGLTTLVVSCQDISDRVIYRVILYGRNICNLLIDECPMISRTVLLLYSLHSQHKLLSFSHQEMDNLALQVLLAYHGGTILKLDISCSVYITDDSVCEIGLNCFSLTDLNLSSCFGLKLGIQTIASSLPMLQTVNLENLENIDDEQFQMLTSSCSCLRVLYLQGSDRITGACLRCIGNFGARLQKLFLIAMKGLTDSVLSAIMTACTSVVELDISVSGITDALFAGGGDQILRNIRVLNMSSSRIGDKTLQIIGSICLDLEKLNISSCPRILISGVACVLKGCPKLQSLDVSYCGYITYRLLLEIPSSTRLRYLNVRSCPRVTKVWLVDLSERVPHLVIDSDVTDHRTERAGKSKFTPLTERNLKRFGKK